MKKVLGKTQYRVKLRYFSAVAVAVVLTLVFYSQAFATDSEGSGKAANSLTIKVGYAGGPQEIVKVYSVAEVKALGQREQVYTWITNVHTPIYHVVRGTSLKAILKDSGIDLNSVARIHFTCSDAHETVDLTIGYLFNSKRYYYPNLVPTWDFDKKVAGVDAKVGAIEVATVLATEEYWQKTTPSTPGPVPFSEMGSSKRFRLAFGMTDTVTPTSYNSAQYIHSIEITLAGAPPSEPQKDGTSQDKLIGSKKGSKGNGQSDSAGNMGGGTSSSENDASSDVNSITPRLIPLSVGGDGNGYQSWRLNEMSKDAGPYVPTKTENRMGGVVAACIGVLFLFGGVLRYFTFRKLNF